MGLAHLPSNACTSRPLADGLSAMFSLHRTKGYSNVILSTKAVGVPPGDVSAEQMLAVASWAEQFGVGEIRITHEQNLCCHIFPKATY